MLGFLKKEPGILACEKVLDNPVFLRFQLKEPLSLAYFDK
jgi:hypothetical protein